MVRTGNIGHEYFILQDHLNITVHTEYGHVLTLQIDRGIERADFKYNRANCKNKFPQRK